MIESFNLEIYFDSFYYEDSFPQSRVGFEQISKNYGVIYVTNFLKEYITSSLDSQIVKIKETLGTIIIIQQQNSRICNILIIGIIRSNSQC